MSIPGIGKPQELPEPKAVSVTESFWQATNIPVFENWNGTFVQRHPDYQGTPNAPGTVFLTKRELWWKKHHGLNNDIADVWRYGVRNPMDHKPWWVTWNPVETLVTVLDVTLVTVLVISVLGILPAIGVGVAWMMGAGTFGYWLGAGLGVGIDLIIIGDSADANYD